jgi:hypothetical protein
MATKWTNKGVAIYYPYDVATTTIGSFTAPSLTYVIATDTTDLFVGCRAPYTQKILNNLPQWMKMRQSHNGIGQKLVHSWACNLEDSYEYFSEIKANQFIDTADIYRDIHTSVSELSFGDNTIYTPEFRNFLYNSSFSIKGIARHGAPDGWGHSRNIASAISLDTKEALFGTYCVKMVGSTYLRQSRKLTISAGHLNFSAYIKTLDTALDETELYTVSQSALVIDLTFADGTTESHGIGLPKNTVGKWVRGSFSVEITKELNKYDVYVINTTTETLYVDMLQLEANSIATAWTNSISDMPPYSKSRIRSTNSLQILSSSEDDQSVTKVEPISLSSEEEFRDHSIPTRIEGFSPKNTPNHSSSSRLGRQINFYKEVLPTVWNPFENAIQEESYLTRDVFVSVHPADLYTDYLGGLKLDKTAITASEILVKATVTHNNWLYVITQETFAGETYFYLKVCKAKKIAYEDTYVPSYGDLKLNINLGSSFGLNSLPESIASMGICKNIPNAIYIDTDKNRRLYFKLKYDHFFADFASRKLFFREDYSAHHGHLQIL